MRLTAHTTPSEHDDDSHAPRHHSPREKKQRDRDDCRSERTDPGGGDDRVDSSLLSPTEQTSHVSSSSYDYLRVDTRCNPVDKNVGSMALPSSIGGSGGSKNSG